METRSVHFSSEYVGSPCIAALDHDHSVVADGTGHLTLINLTSKAIPARLFVGVTGGHASCNLRSLRPGPPGLHTVAVATRSGYAVVVGFESQAVTKIYPEQGGTVNAVSLSPDGQFLAIGTGSYSLTGDPQPAHLELWDVPPGGSPHIGRSRPCRESARMRSPGAPIAVGSPVRPGCGRRRAATSRSSTARNSVRSPSSKSPGPVRDDSPISTTTHLSATWPSTSAAGSASWIPGMARRPGRSIPPRHPTCSRTSNMIRRTGRSY